MATALAAALTIAGCQDGYPIAATRCDRFCDLTQAQCAGYSPATCVFSCEQGFGNLNCVPEFEAFLGCREMHETRCANFSSFGEPLMCEETYNALLSCTEAAHTGRRNTE